MKPHRPYQLEEYNPEWKQRFVVAKEELRSIFGDNLVEIDHIGSTSIVGMVAKPQIDVLAVVRDLDSVAKLHNEFEKAGYVPRGRGYVADDDEYMSKDDPDGTRIVSVHTLQTGNPKIVEYQNFRDYLQQNEEDRNLYIATKRALYASHNDNYAEYDSGKKDVISAIKARAKQWASKKTPDPSTSASS